MLEAQPRALPARLARLGRVADALQQEDLGICRQAEVLAVELLVGSAEAGRSQPLIDGHQRRLGDALTAVHVGDDPTS